jgi:ubiquitin-conjugating enzyme E2 Q
LIDVSEYPEGNSFMLFTKSSEVPNGVNDVLEDVKNFSTGMKISELLLAISQRLQKVLASGTQADPFNVDDGSDVEMVDGGGEESEGEYEEDDEEEEEDEPFGYDDDDDGFGTFGPSDGKRLSTSSTYRISPEAAASINRRIRTDLRAAKFAGFKLGILSGMKAESHTSLLSISIQAAKLGLSDEALQAWDLEPQQYIVLLVRYSAGYKPYESVISEPAKALDISFRIGVSNKYKPTLVEALAAFTEMTKNGSHSHDDQNNAPNQEEKSDAGFSSLFISSSLNEFFNEQYVSLLKIRSSVHVGWDGAKLFFNEQQGKINIENAELKEEYFKETPPANSLPEIMTADHLTDTNSGTTSFPLITAQFAMRYLLRCTEFCLVCHDRISGGFEALKPYVCDKPLCLYQYMSLGFGPSVEHEILTQPFVVDLLVSFCYSAALVRYASLRESTY